MNPHPDEGALLATFPDTTAEERALWDSCFAHACMNVTDSAMAHRLANAALLARRKTFPNTTPT